MCLSAFMQLMPPSLRNAPLRRELLLVYHKWRLQPMRARYQCQAKMQFGAAIKQLRAAVRTVNSFASSLGASATSMALSSAGRSWYSTRTCRAAARACASVSATTMPISCTRDDNKPRQHVAYTLVSLDTPC